ncbi:cytochrome C oxidase subunit IV family protein [Pseudotenacibaculum haliotis]|uniref:Cytochrome C oxidase subunit IV family protein n=1 Tax=Pseudotenacibaculum haliotis TaxID=1862138 RepID=A0ABW5LV47_9FLAO
MAHAHDNSNVKRIWIVFGLLSIVTIVEVGLGIVKPDSLHLNGLGTSWLNWIFIILTLVKAYYITWTFMHMEGEKTWFRRSVVWTAVFLIIYLVTLLIIEGGYLYDTLSPLVRW